MDQTNARGRLLAPRLVGAILLAVTAAIHLDLYVTSYHDIPTIGWLFLLQVIVAIALAIAVVVVPGPLAPAAGAGFAVATLGGYLLTVWVGLFGFQEVRTTAGIVAGVVEVAAFGILGYVALGGLPVRLPGGGTGAVAALSVAALVVLGVSVGTASSGGGGPSSPAVAGGSGPVVRVLIKDFKFVPDNPDVKPGERIEVTNEDSVDHSLTAGRSPKDNNLFSTGLIGLDKSVIITAPQKPGMYPFYCTVHHFMTGMLIVGQ